MGQDYFFFYTEANIVCIIIFLFLLVHDKLYNTRQEKQIWYDRTVIAHILYFLSDIGWAAVLSGQLPRTRLLVITFNFLNFILLGLIAYGWFMYMAASENMLIGKTRKQRLLLELPLFISFAAMVIAYIVDPFFWVSETGELSFWYYPMMLAAPLLYIFASAVISFVNAAKVEARDRKVRYLLIGMYPLSVVFFGLLQLIALDAPLFCFGCTIMMLFFYIQSMQGQISADSLTGLNNRRHLDRYLRMVRYREQNRSWAVMIDIDHFKQINDTYGHTEGDRALILVAETLKKSCEKIRSSVFPGRYGGDEFTMIIESAEEETLEALRDNLRETLRKKQEENHLLYNLQISMGYDCLQGPEDTMEACLVRADEKLYQDKRRAH